MAAPPVVTLKVSFALLVVLSWAGTAGAQTSIDDVHVAPRHTAAVLSSALNSTRSAEGSALHVIKTEAKLVLVPVIVTDGMQRFVNGLHEENFEILEGKKPQVIQSVSREDSPVSIGIILDTSGSMGGKMDRVHQAVTQFCEAANPQDEFFMIEFSDEPRLVTDFTTASDDLEHELLFARPKGRTALLDAIYMGLHQMKRAKYGKKALLIISDGGDNHSRYGEREVKAAAKESDVMIYSIGVFDRYVPTTEELRGPYLLSEIAEPTGGRAFTLESPSEMPAVAQRIGVELRTQYVLAYRPQEMSHDGKWHKIKVRLRLPRKLFLQARAKTGYYSTPQ